MDRIAAPRYLLRLVKILLRNDREASLKMTVGNEHPKTATRKMHIETSHCKAVQETHQVATAGINNPFEFHGKWPQGEQQQFIKDLRVVQDFISAEEETKLLEEIEPYMKRLHYEFDHWDDAIHGFRETERKHWYPHNRALLERVRQLAFDGGVMPYVHVLDLAAEGVIKPHVDSSRYCGNTIAGMSLLSQCVMRLVRVDDQQYQQQPVQGEVGEHTDGSSVGTQQSVSDDSYRSQPRTNLENNFYVDVLLQRRSLYIMSRSSRYKFTHEILANKFSKFQRQPVQKGRRISIICRNEP